MSHLHPRLPQQLLGILLTASLPALPVLADQGVYQQHNLVASTAAIPADRIDPDLVNAWGIAFNPNAVVWVADNGTAKSTLYDGAGNKQGLVVDIPGPATGIVFNSSADFQAPNTVDNTTNPSRFIFVTEDGQVVAWAPPPGMSPPTGSVVVASTSGAVYKGLALAGNGSGHFLYATNFSQGTVDVFDSGFQPTTLAGSFEDPRIPAGFAPFGIQNINGDIYVTYAKQDATKTDDVAGQGLGFVDVFDADGRLLRRIAARGPLNAPWGLALAPAGFGRLAGLLLVGNFGDGRINAFDPVSGNFAGQLRGLDHRPLVIDGLWGLSFGNGVFGQPVDVLFFTAGPADESQGLYGRIEPVAGSNSVMDEHHGRSMFDD